MKKKALTTPAKSKTITKRSAGYLQIRQPLVAEFRGEEQVA